ncbi:hypothetical protein LTR67_006816 [Exophiala xenobiotica]
MSMNEPHLPDDYPSPSLKDLYLGASSSSSRIPSPQNDATRAAHLAIPSFHHRRSRPSLDSTYSELSELSFHSNELQTRHPLTRSRSQDASLPTDSSWRGRIKAAFRRFYVFNYGAMLVVLAQFFGVGMNVSTRLLETAGSHGAPMHPYQILFVRQSITASLCTAYGLYTKSVPDFPLGPRQVRWLLVARGLFGFMGVFGMYFSLLYLPLSEATVLTFLSPILSCYLCTFIIPGETFSRQQQLAGLVSLIGVIFIAQPASLLSSSSTTATETSTPSVTSPTSNSTVVDSSSSSQRDGPTSHQHLVAIGIAMIGVIGSTGVFTAIRAIGTRAHAFISINYFSIWCTIVSLFCLIVFPDVKFRLPANLIEWSLLISLGFCGFVMQFLLTAGLSYGGPGPANPSQSLQRRTAVIQSHPQKFTDVESHGLSTAVPADMVEGGAASQRQWSIPKPSASGSGTRATSMVYTQMFFALAGDKLVFGITPTTMSWVGSVLILAGAVWVAAARDTATKHERASNDTGSGTDAVVPTGRGRGKESQTTEEEVVGLMQDHEADDLYDREHEANGLGTEPDGNRTVETMELHELRPTISRS